MKLYLTHIQDISDEHMSLISPERAEKASRYRFSADKKRCIAGGLLLRRFLGDTVVFADAFGKPRAKSGVCFNLSHSGDWVLLAVGDTEIGCDIERASSDPQALFYALWTKKEALLKCMGKGFHRAAKSVDVCGSTFCEDGHTYYMKTKSFDGYTLSVCVMDGEAQVETEQVTFK